MLTDAAVAARMPDHTHHTMSEPAGHPFGSRSCCGGRPADCEDGPDRQVHDVRMPRAVRPDEAPVARAVDVLAAYALLESEGLAPILLCARLRGRLSGVAVVRPVQDVAGRRCLELREVVLAPGYRRQVVARAVLRELVRLGEAECRRRGIDRVLLRVFTQMSRLVDLGVAMGFAVYAEQGEWTLLYRSVALEPEGAA